MANSVTFPATTNSVGLPLLFTGQAQKEFSINQSFITLDALQSRGVEATLGAPPTSPNDGDCYLVEGGATGDWLGQDNHLAISIGGSWQFIAPQAGMEVFDRAAGQKLFYKSDWASAANIPAASGGSVIDFEARTALTQVIEVLQNAGIFPEN